MVPALEVGDVAEPGVEPREAVAPAVVAGDVAPPDVDCEVLDDVLDGVELPDVDDGVVDVADVVVDMTAEVVALWPQALSPTTPATVTMTFPQEVFILPS